MAKSIEGMIKFATDRMTKNKYTPADVKRSLMRWTFDPNEKDIDTAVRIAAARLGVENDSK